MAGAVQGPLLDRGGDAGVGRGQPAVRVSGDARAVDVVARQQFAADRAFWTFIEVSRDVLGAAEALSGAHTLRALDAIHLASAQLFTARIVSPGFVFVSADVRQTSAASALGMSTRQINQRSE